MAEVGECPFSSFGLKKLKIVIIDYRGRSKSVWVMSIDNRQGIAREDKSVSTNTIILIMTIPFLEMKKNSSKMHIR